jgi:hypothetical protein
MVSRRGLPNLEVRQHRSGDKEMQVNIIEEAGYNAALYGFSLSYKDRAIPREEWWCGDADCKHESGDLHYFCGSCDIQKREDQISKTATANAGRDGGHNKFLEHIQVWLDIEASLEFWKQMDTYRVGVSKQSESSMHTLDRRDAVVEDFELTKDELALNCIADPSEMGDHSVPTLEHILGLYLNYLNHMSPRLKSKLLPQGYLQRRELVLSYKVLRHIINQRKGHKLPEWSYFIDTIYAQAQHPELLPQIGE